MITQVIKIFKWNTKRYCFGLHFAQVVEISFKQNRYIFLCMLKKLLK